jgi:rubrerythrin
MSDPIEVIAEYTTEAEAQVALARLREEGIDGQVDGFAGQSVPVAPFRLSVASSQAARALQIIEDHSKAQLAEGWEDDAEAAVDGWICAMCDTPVELTEAYCPECGAPRTAVRADDEGE